MQNVVYSFDPRSGSNNEEIQAEVRSRYLTPDRRQATWQYEDGADESNQQVADIMAHTRPLRLRA